MIFCFLLHITGKTKHSYCTFGNIKHILSHWKYSIRIFIKKKICFTFIANWKISLRKPKSIYPIMSKTSGYFMGFWSVWNIAINDISFVISVSVSACPSVRTSVRPHGTTQLPLCGNSSFVNIWQELRVLNVKNSVHFWSYIAQFFLEWELFRQNL
jgi:hypothetical protein